MKVRTLFVGATLALSHNAVAEERSLLTRPILDATTTSSRDRAQATQLEGQRLADAQSVVLSKEDSAALLQQKLRTVTQLQSEIQKLRAEAGIHQQIRVRVEMLEVSMTKLRKLQPTIASQFGSARVDTLENLQKYLGATVAESDAPRPKLSPSASNFVEWMKDNNLAKVVSRPTVVTESGRPASVFIGNEVPVPTRGADGTSTEMQRVGTELDVVANAMPESTVRLDVRMRVSELRTDSVPTGQSRVPIDVRSCDTCVTTRFGQPVVLGGIVSDRLESIKRNTEVVTQVNEVALLVIVTPETDGPIATAKKASSGAVK